MHGSSNRGRRHHRCADACRLLRRVRTLADRATPSVASSLWPAGMINGGAVIDSARRVRFVLIGRVVVGGVGVDTRGGDGSGAAEDYILRLPATWRNASAVASETPAEGFFHGRFRIIEVLPAGVVA